MSRKAGCADKAPIVPPNKSSNIEGHRLQSHTESKQDQSHNRQSPIHGSIHKASGDSAGGSAMDSTGNDTDDDDGDSTNDDDEESNGSEDPDVIAPSGLSTEDGHQAGPTHGIADVKKPTHHSEHSVQHNIQQDSSDDEIYDAINSMSNSEKDGSDMDQLEERAIVDSETIDEPSRGRSRAVKEVTPGPGVLSSTMSEDMWDGLLFDQSQVDAHSDYFHEQFSHMDQQALDHDDRDHLNNLAGDFGRVTPDSPDVPTHPLQRRVRFAEPPHSEISSPDLQPYENISMFEDPAPAPPSSPFSGEEYGLDTDSDTSDGYESDYGETTDEDDIPASATARPEALIRQPSTPISKLTSSATSTPTRKSSSRCSGPRMGSWCVDPTKPLAFVDSCGKRLLVCPARRPTKPDKVFEHLLGSGLSTVHTSPQLPLSTLATPSNDGEFDHSDFSSQEMVSPMFGPPNPLDSILSNNNFISSTSVFASHEDNPLAMFGDSEYDDDDDDHEDGIRMEDLINFGSDDDNSEGEMEDTRPSSSNSSLLDHLDSGIVTAFRQNQRQFGQSDQHMLPGRSPLRKRKASPPLREATRRRIMA